MNVTATVHCGAGFVILHAGGIQLAHAVPREIAEALIAREEELAALVDAAKEAIDYYEPVVPRHMAALVAALANINGETT